MVVPGAKPFDIVILHLKNNCIFQCFDIERSGGLRNVTVKVTHKPIFYRDLNRVVFAVIIQKERSKGALNDVVSIQAHKTRLIQELTLLNSCRPDNGNKLCLFFRKKIDIASDVAQYATVVFQNANFNVFTRGDR